MKSLRPLCQLLGLHPLVGLGMFAVDWMLFGGEAATLGVSWVVSIAVAAVLTVAAVFIQRFAFADSWGAAAGKSLLVGLLTAIPTALPAIFSLVGGALGALKLLLPERKE